MGIASTSIAFVSSVTSIRSSAVAMSLLLLKSVNRLTLDVVFEDLLGVFYGESLFVSLLMLWEGLYI